MTDDYMTLERKFAECIEQRNQNQGELSKALNKIEILKSKLQTIQQTCQIGLEGPSMKRDPAMSLERAENEHMRLALKNVIEFVDRLVS